MEVAAFTEIAATVFATIGIVFGMGATFWKGFQEGVCSLPSVMIWWVNIPMSLAVALRATTFVLNGDYWFFIAIDVAAFVILMGIVGQYFGLFLKKMPSTEAPS